MTRNQALKLAHDQLASADAKIRSLTLNGQAAEAAQLRIRLARGYIDLARELDNK
jgi:hypothetical protein